MQKRIWGVVVSVLVISIMSSICFFALKVGDGEYRNISTESAETEQIVSVESEDSDSGAVEEVAENPEESTEEAESTEDGVLIDNQYLEEAQLKEVMTLLEKLPDDAESLEQEGGFIVTYRKVFGVNHLESFRDCYEKGRSANLLTGCYTTEGDLILYYLIYDGEKLTLVVDTRRDQWARAQIYVTQHQYFSIMEQEQEGNLLRTLLLHNDSEMTIHKWTSLDPMDEKSWEGLWKITDFIEFSVDSE